MKTITSLPTHLRRLPALVLALLAALAAVGSVNAATITYSGLQGLVTGGINGQNDNASQWYAGWSVQNGNNSNYTVQNATPLTFGNLATSSDGNYLNGGGSFLNMGRRLPTGYQSIWDLNGSVSDVWTAGQIDQGTVWVSFLMRVNSSITSWDNAKIALHGNATPYDFSGGGLQIATVSGNSSWGIRVGDSGAASTLGSVSVGTTMFVVIKLELSTSAGANNAYVWMFSDPNAANLGGADLNTGTAMASLTGKNTTDLRFKCIAFYLDNAANRISMDEFRFGTDYASVSPLAGPTTAPTTTALGSAPNPSTFGQSVTFTATVHTNGATATAVTGSVVFQENGSPVYTNNSPVNGVFTYTTSALSVGVHPFSAVYSGDSNYSASTSASTNQTVQSAVAAPPGVIAYWDFTPSNYISAVTAGTAGFTSPQVASIANSNVIVSALGAGASVHLDNNGNSIWNSECGYGTTISGDPGVLANVLNAGYYYDFTLQVAPGYTLNLTNITISAGEGSYFGWNYNSYVFSSLTGFNDTNVLGSGANGYLWTQYAATHLDLSPYSVDLSSANPKAGITLQNLTSASGTVEFRVYVGMPNYVQSGIQQLSLNGTVVAGYPKPATITTVTSSLNPSTNNQTVVFTATVKTNGVSPVTAGNAGGTMVFSDNTGPLATNNVVNGIAKFTNSYALGGSYPIVATYSGDANYQSSYSATFNQLVNPTTTTLSVDVNPALVGDVVTFTATITPNEADYGSSAGGTVNFYDNGVLLQSVTSTPFPGYPDTVAIFQTFTSAGTHVITAVYQGAGDGLGLAPSTSAPLNETILEVSGLWATNTSAQVIDFDHTINNPSVGGNPGLDGQVLINVGPVAGPNIVQLYEPNAYGPTNSFSPMAWSVMGSNDNFGLGVGVPTSFGQDANGNAITTDRIDDYALQLVSNASTPSGNNPNFATFPSGQGNALLFNAASSFQSQKAITLRVVNGTGAKVAGWNLSLKAWGYGTNGPTALQVQTSPDNVNYTTSLLVANATNGPDATSLISLGTFATSVGVPVKTNGVLYVRLNYPKPTNPSYAGNGFIIDDLSVQASTDASTTNTVASSISPSVFGQSVVLTDTVAPALTGGTVQFYDNGVALGSPVAVTGGLAKLTNSLFTATNHLITATYSGKTGYLGSYSTNALTQTVNAASTTSTVASSKNPSNVGDDVSFTNTIAVVAPGVGTPTGNVTFKDGTNVLGTAALAGGVAVYDAGTGLAQGTHPITAEYAGDGNFKGSTNSVSQVVNSVVLTPPTLGGATSSGGQFQITFSGPSGQTYAVLSTTNLANGPWITNSTGTFSGGSVTYTNTTPNDPQRFYRIQSP